jgi:ubiquinone/menaquinone biosynthesis C-methylase UbiE
MPESRSYNAEYYDLMTQQDADTRFYLGLVSRNVRVLELGCGTGRVSLPLAERAKKVTAVDLSKPMLERARSKDEAGLVTFVLGDIVTLDLGEKFDLIIAPFRVMQALESDEQVDGFF